MTITVGPCFYMDYWEPVSVGELNRILNRIRERRPSWAIVTQERTDAVEIVGNTSEGIRVRLRRDNSPYRRLSLEVNDIVEKAKICATQYETSYGHNAADEHRLLDAFIEEVRGECLRLRQLGLDAEARKNKAAKGKL